MTLDLNDPVFRRIVEARVYLLLNHPFFGNLATRLQLVDATKWCPTAATDGRRFYYNREFIKNLTRQELVFLVGHEILHCVYDHIGRRSNRDPQMWNMATDYIVNYTLVKNEIGDMIKSGLFSDKYTDTMSSEEVYDLLKKNNVQIQMTIDVHLDSPGAGDGDGDADGKGKKTVTVNVSGEDGPPTLTEEELNEIRNEVKAAVISAAQQAKGAGNLPASIARMIEDMTEPKMDWRELLALTLKSTIRDDYTFTRLSNLTWSSGFIIPGQKDQDTIDIEVFLDASGSITNEMLREFLSEVKGIMDEFTQFRLGVGTFDTKVYNYKVFTHENSDELMSYDLKGGGGTSFECVYEFMRENEIEPNMMVMFTDGYPCGSWGEEAYCDALFVIHGNDSIVPPFGSHAYYDDHKQSR